MVELKARFDEQANIAWAKKLEQAGVHVVYGIPAMKTHAKCALVARREGDGVRHYVHVGTGNYNPKTARLYTDLGLFTTDPDICADIAEMFNYLTGYARPQRYRKALIAPHNLFEGLLEEIEKTIDVPLRRAPGADPDEDELAARPGDDQGALRASQAGVRVELNVRGICALRPGVEGVSENISVVSVLGRFLEHSRIYSFERPGEQTIFTGSADLMPRNLYNRVELVIPIEDEAVRERDDSRSSISASPTTPAAGSSAPTATGRGAGPRAGRRCDVQQEMIERAHARAAEAVTPIV